MKSTLVIFTLIFASIYFVQAQINIHLGGGPYDRPYYGNINGGYGGYYHRPAAYGPRPYTGPYTGLYAGGPVQPKYGYADSPRGYYGFRNDRVLGWNIW